MARPDDNGNRTLTCPQCDSAWFDVKPAPGEADRPPAVNFQQFDGEERPQLAGWSAEFACSDCGTMLPPEALFADLRTPRLTLVRDADEPPELS